jgi:queuosine precursor transporter
LGLWWSIAAILLGAILSAGFAPPALVVASATAFLLSETADLLVFTPLQRRGLVRAAMASSGLGLVVDSVVFLSLAFGSLQFLPGQIVGKALMVLLTLPLLRNGCGSATSASAFNLRDRGKSVGWCRKRESNPRPHHYEC